MSDLHNLAAGESKKLQSFNFIQLPEYRNLSNYVHLLQFTACFPVGKSVALTKETYVGRVRERPAQDARIREV